MNPSIRLFTEDDWAEVAEIYRLGLLTRNATFETEVPDFAFWYRKFHADLLFVIKVDDAVAGWAGLMPVSARQAYAGVTELSIYLHPDYAGKGLGKLLLTELIRTSEQKGIWTIYASLFPENTASIKLHEATDFRKIGYRERIARLDGVWRNTVIYERRSQE